MLRSGKNMGERLAVGLPSGEGELRRLRNKQRFVSQFVGSVRNKGQGLPFELGLLDVNEDGEVQFTENGARFMLLENPLFDTSMAWKDGESFSLAEKQFLITMIRRNVPGEFDFMQEISNWISEGVVRSR